MEPAERAEIIRIIYETIMDTARGNPGPLSGRILDAIEAAGYRVVWTERRERAPE